MSLRGVDNVILNDGTSVLFRVKDYDTAYVVGNCVDVRGLPTSDEKRIPVADILLRISIAPDPTEAISTDDYSYSDLKRIQAGEKL